MQKNRNLIKTENLKVIPEIFKILEIKMQHNVIGYEVHFVEDVTIREMIKKAQKVRPDLYLNTFFIKNNQETDGLDPTKQHYVAEFYYRPYCVLIDRKDGIKWGLYKG